MGPNAELSGWLERRHEVAPLDSPLERRVRLIASPRLVAPPGCMQTSLCRSVALCNTEWRMNRAMLFLKNMARLHFPNRDVRTCRARRCDEDNLARTTNAARVTDCL